MKRMAIAILLMFSGAANALELFIGAGLCEADRPSVCDEGVTFNAHLAQWWNLPADSWSAGVIGGHISHIDQGEYVRLLGRSFHGSGEINYITAGVRFEW